MENTTFEKRMTSKLIQEQRKSKNSWFARLMANFILSLVILVLGSPFILIGVLLQKYVFHF